MDKTIDLTGCLADLYIRVVSFQGTRESASIRHGWQPGRTTLDFDGARVAVDMQVVLESDANGPDQAEPERLLANQVELKRPLPGQSVQGTVSFQVESGCLASCNVAVGLSLSFSSPDDYVFAPAAAYAGNRFRTVKRKYPPMLLPEDSAGPGMEPLLSDVPGLAKDSARSRLHLLSGDMATPCLGVFQPGLGRAILWYGPHDSLVGYTGFSYREQDGTAEIELSAPGVREHAYRICSTGQFSSDQPASLLPGTVVQLPFAMFMFPCASIASFFDVFFATRSCMNAIQSWHHELPFSQAYDIIAAKYDASQWNEQQAYWRISPDDGPYNDWQAGWVGGGISAYTLALEGPVRARVRSAQTFDTIFAHLQTSRGYICPILYQGERLGDNFYELHRDNFLLLRKNADLLYFACKYMLRCPTESSPLWLQGIRNLADVFVRLWHRHGQLGQFVDMDNDDILAGGTASPAIAIAGLSLAYRLTDDSRYRRTACELADYYLEHYLNRGLMNGGPGDALQVPDSESAFGLLEGLACLGELTHDAKWISALEQCAHLCSSWCVSYDFHFPEQSEFGRLNLRSRGTVYANVQNKHAAPGICTLSPTALLVLYRMTGKSGYLELAGEIAHQVTQFLSREDRPIHDWDGRPLPPGWMCERVNLSDWEGKEKIGGVFRGSCWCEISCMLTYTDMPGIYLRADTGECAVFDHVEASVIDGPGAWIVSIVNPTSFAMRLRLVVDGSRHLAQPWIQVCDSQGRMLDLQPGEAKTISIEKE